MNMRYHNNDTTLVGRLADQAHNVAVELYNERMKTEHPADVVFYDMFNQKFAELIIQECIAMCSTAVGNRDYNTGRLHCVENIKEHFGVE